MRSFRFILVFLFVLSTNLLAVDRAGLVSDVAGKVVQLKNERADKLLPLHVDDDLFFHDAVITGDASNAGLLLSPDDKKIRFFIYENSKLKIDPVLVREGKKNFAAKISKGMLRVLTQKLQGDTVTITAPNLTVGIRGTHVSVSTETEMGQMSTTVANHRTVGADISSAPSCEVPSLSGEPSGGAEEPAIVRFTPDLKKPEETKMVPIAPGEEVTISTDLENLKSSASEKTVATEAIPSLIGLRRERCGQVALPHSDELNPVALEELIMDFAVLGLRRCL